MLLVGALAWAATGGRLLPRGTTADPSVASAQDAGPRLGFEEAATPLGAPSGGAVGSTAFRFKSLQPGSTVPVTFSPCRPLHYVVRPDNAPPGGDELIAAAVEAASRATGLRFVYDGATSEPLLPEREPYQPARYGQRWAPVLIGWGTPDEVPDFGVDIVGEASSQQMTRPNGARVYVTGAIYLDAVKARQILNRRNGAHIMQTIVEHELGHLVGLAHVNDRSQVMYPRTSRNVFGYQAGDLTGLAALGQGACAPDV